MIKDFNSTKAVRSLILVLFLIEIGWKPEYTWYLIHWASSPRWDEKNQPFMVVFLVHSNSERISKGLFFTKQTKAASRGPQMGVVKIGPNIE
jgi:hypothetical protein